MTDVEFLPALEQARLIRQREVSSLELVTMYLERIDLLDERLNAFVTVVGPETERAARAADLAVAHGDELPPFHGVPIAIKDLAETKGIRSTFSCEPLAEYVPDIDNAAVRRIREAGFIILGKTNAPEFGTVPQTESRLNGICRNPWNTEFTPGGSSGGAAAALAAGMIPVAHGSDGGGSIRIPASCCGLFGIKPARGRVSNGPRFGEVMAGFSTEGPISRSVADAAALLDVMSGYEVGDPYWAPPPERPFAEEAAADPGVLRVGFTLVGGNDTPVEDEVAGAVRDTAVLLESLGHEVEEITPQWNEPELTSHFITIWQSGSCYYAGIDPAALEPLNRVLAETAAGTTMDAYLQARIQVEAFARRVVGLWDDYDVILTPTMPQTPRPVGWIFEEEDPWMQLVRAGMVVPFTVGANITGQPAVSVPLHWSASGLPIGSQFIGRPADEATLIRLSAQLEEARPWANKRPLVSPS
ncbi:MAG: amidase [Actinomycetota bacterium]